MVHAAALVIALSSVRVDCTMPSSSVPLFSAITPPYDAEVQSGPIAVQVRVRAPRVAEPWSLVSDMTLLSSTGESMKATSPEIQRSDLGSIATFFFANVNRGRTYHVQLHWQEPKLPGCPPVKWTSMLGQFSTL